MTDLVAAWKAWDRKPEAAINARRMEDACQEEAKNLGWDATELRVVLAACARSGMTRDEALAKARQFFSAP